ncbi:MAG: hypothetical protein KJO12_06745, partial [Ignavibacteria bacterium]|nr:hypothetical protein [Ignavibacteria bacterium]
MKSRVISFLLAAMMLVVVSCSGNQSEFNVTKNKGNLTLRLVSWDDDVTGVLFQVLHEGNIVGESYKPLEEEFLPQYLDDRSGPGHHFADMFFVLAPGTYTARSIPMISEDKRSKLCLPAETKVEVNEHKTTEIVLVMQCDLEDNGALDILGQLNR